jgi:Mn-dependent DtxR family transcriptional regulator
MGRDVSASSRRFNGTPPEISKYLKDLSKQGYIVEQKPRNPHWQVRDGETKRLVTVISLTPKSPWAALRRARAHIRAHEQKKDSN